VCTQLCPCCCLSLEHRSVVRGAKCDQRVKCGRRYAVAKSGQERQDQFLEHAFDVLLAEIRTDEWVLKQRNVDLGDGNFRRFIDRASMASAFLSHVIPTEEAGSEVVGTHVNTDRVLRRFRALMQVHNVAGKSSPEAALQAGLQHHGGLLTGLAIQLGQEPKALWFLKGGALDSVVWVHCYTSM